MTASPKVSVLLTSYNHAKHLRESIESVLSQTFKDFELHIWDDGSTDNSWEIISSYSDKRIRAVRNKANSFLDCFIDHISRSAFSEYIAIHHSDDIWEPQKLEKQVAFLDANPDVGAVFTKVKLIDEDGSPFKDENHLYYKAFEQPNRTRFEWLNHFFYAGNALCHPSILIRRVCYEECGAYRYGLAQLPDFDMWVRLCLKYEIHVLPEKLIQFRIRNNEANTSGDRPEMHIRLQFEFLQIYSNYLSITDKEVFLKVFPASSKYLDNEDFDISFALAMMSLSSPHPSGKLFGLQLLFDTLNKPELAKKMGRLYGFHSLDLIDLTAKHDVFSIVRLKEKDTQVANLSMQLAGIYSSTAWRLVMYFRRIHLLLAPKNSKREKLIQLIWRGWRMTNRDLTLLRKSDLYNEEWYLANNPEAARARIDPARHYMLHGGFDALDPSPSFDSRWYLDTYPDVKNAQINPLLHYLKRGQSEGRQIRPSKVSKSSSHLADH